MVKLRIQSRCLAPCAWCFLGPRWLAERYRLPGRLRPYLACLWHPAVVLAQGAAAAWTLATRR